MRRWRIVRVLLGTVVASLLIAWAITQDHAEHDFWTYAAWAAILTGGGPLFFVLAAAARAWSCPSSQSVEVGIDGVLVGARFIPYGAIGSVEHERRARMVTVALQGGGEDEQTVYYWTVSLVVGGVRGGGPLLGGETIDLVTSHVESEDPLGAGIARAIEEAWVAWRAGQRDDGCEGQLSRGARNSSEWLEALRKLGGLGATPYRRADANLHDLSRLLGDPRVKPSTRAAAAVVLRASGDETAVVKLRIAAATIVEPRVRIALENIADDMAVAEALAILDEADGEREGEEGRLSTSRAKQMSP
jgi:hypothetical protein